MLTGVLRVLVDEMHERSVESDILLVILQRSLQQYPSRTLVLSTHYLLRYFGGGLSNAYHNPRHLVSPHAVLTRLSVSVAGRFAPVTIRSKSIRPTT